MSTFTNALASSEYGVSVNYGGSYVAYVTEDLERGGYHIAYCKRHQDMPPHRAERAETAEQVETILADCGADFESVAEIEAEDN